MNKNSNKLGLFVWAVFLTSLGILTGYFLIYKLLIVPQLLKWNQIPLLWWFIGLLPILVVVIYIGTRVHSFYDLGATVLGSAISTISITYTLLALGEGHDVELGWDYFFSSFPMQIVTYLLFYALAYGFIWFIRKKAYKKK